jgi:hypothetical protein
LLGRLLARRQDRRRDHAVQASELRKQRRETEKKIERLYTALAEGTVSDTDLFRDTLSNYERDLDELKRRETALDHRREIAHDLLTPRNLARFSKAVRERLHNSDSAFRKSYMRQFVDRVEVDDEEVRIFGPEAALLQGLATGPSPSACPVPGFDTKWWAHKDSNLGPAD